MSGEKCYYVYIFTNPSRTLYTGMTNNLRRRLDEPNFEVFEDVRNAIDCEKKVKPWSRAKRVALVESKNPKWDDLSGDWDQPQTFRLVS